MSGIIQRRFLTRGYLGLPGEGCEELHGYSVGLMLSYEGDWMKKSIAAMFVLVLSIMPSGDFNIALVLGMKDMSIGALDIPMSWLNVILTAMMGIIAWAGSRRIFGGHQVT